MNVYTALDDAAGCPAPVTQAFTYDGDANMTGDGQWTYEWDWENRLREAREAGPVEGSKKLVFRYDYMNRRIRKEVFTYDATAEAWRTTPESDTRFIYDGWNVILELDALDDNAVRRKYMWGLDLSGTRQGAGGIGGLLAVHDAAASKDYIVFSDANGNVGQLVDWSPIANWQSFGLSSANDWHASRLAARYEYDAYGNTLVSDGPYADDNPFRFSTKYFDAETVLYYYGRRFYRPDIGRWVSRDPRGAKGGVNLARFCRNSTVQYVDPIGLTSTEAACEKCGMEIGQSLDKMLTAVETSFRSKSPLDKGRICRNMWSSSGWDVYELYQAGGGDSRSSGVYTNPFSNGSCGKGKCAGTVTIHGKCYWAAEANYILWGKGNALCFDTFNQWARHLQGGPADSRFDQDGYEHEEGDFDITTAEEAAGLWRFVKYLAFWNWLDSNIKTGGWGPGGRQSFTRVGFFDDYSQAVSHQVKGCAPCGSTYSGNLAAYLGKNEELQVNTE